MVKAYIERDVALEIISDVIHDEKTYRKVRAIRRRMEKTPAADVVEVVRCKECKHRDPENGHCDNVFSTNLPFSREPDEYCSYGERKKV